MFGQTCGLKHLPGYKAGKNATRTDVVCFDWKTIYVIISRLMAWRHEERLIAAKNQTTTLRFPGGGHIFFEIVKFYSSYKSCNEWVSAYNRVFWIYLLFLVMLILRV